MGIRHILASPFHPQTNGKLERYHRTIKLDVNQTPYDVPGNLEGAITDFVNYYNNRRYHKALGNVTPSDVLDCRREQNLQKRKDVRPRLFSADDYTINNSRARGISTKSPLALCPIVAECLQSQTLSRDRTWSLSHTGASMEQTV